MFEGVIKYTALISDNIAVSVASISRGGVGWETDKQTTNG